MLKRNSFNVHWKFGACQKWEPAGRIGDFRNFLNGFAKTHACFVRFWILNGCNLSWKIVKYCILSEVCMIKTAPHITVSPQSDVMYKKYEMLVYTHPESLARFCWVNLSKAKNRPGLFSRYSFSRPNLLWSRAIMAFKCDRRWLLFFWVYIYRYQFDVRFFSL